MRIVFMGTPEFAAISLEAVAREFEVVAVISQPDKPKGRGMELLPTPVKQRALQLGLPVYQPVTLRDESAVRLIKSFEPDAIAVVAYGKLLPAEVLEIPKYGCINLHGSLLPKYRGAAPLQWAVINGDAVTGTTTMYMAQGMDTGDIIYKYETEIDPYENALELRMRIAPHGAQLLCKTLKDVFDGVAPRTPQNDSEATAAPMIQKEMGELDATRDCVALHNLVRGLAPSPGAFCFAGGKRLKILRTRPQPEMSGEAGSVTLLGGELYLYCGGGALALCEVLPEGRGKMSGAAFYNGKKFTRIDLPVRE